MTLRPSEFVIDWRIVSGAVGASLGHFVLRAQRPTVATALGLGSPLVGLFVLWALLIGFKPRVGGHGRPSDGD